MPEGRVVFLTGAPGVGKSTIGRALAECSERSFFLDLDAFRANVVRGLAQPSTCRVGPRVLAGEAAWIEGYRRLWVARLDALDLVVEDLKRMEATHGND